MSLLFKELTFLVIDGSEPSREMMRNALVSFGVEDVIEVSDAVEGLNILRGGLSTIDFILVDQEMPTLGGDEFTRLVRADKTRLNPMVPIVMMAALADKESVVRACQVGVNAIVAKPFSPKQLYEHIMAVLDGEGGRATTQVPEGPKESDRLEKMTFLVIDDSGLSRKMAKRALKSLGVRTTLEAEDGVEGLAILKKNSTEIDVILVDREMPIFDGLEFTRMVRRDLTLGNPMVPVIMVSGLADKDHILDAKNAGVTAFVAKPYSPAELKEHIHFSIRDPRPFIQAKRYIGPDRRWTKAADEAAGFSRRSTDAKQEI